MHTIAYDNRKLTPVKIKNPVYKIELLAIKSTIYTLNYYMDNAKKKDILTDNKIIIYLQIIKHISKQLA